MWAAAVLGCAVHIFVWPAKISASSHNNSSFTQQQERSNASSRRLPQAARFHAISGRGLMTRVWINGTGPYSFAIDTGAGATILSPRVAGQARVEVKTGRGTMIGGLSGAGAAVSGREAVLQSLSIGDRYNALPARGLVIVTDRLPPDIDGVLDPVESYWPLGFTIDLPNEEITAFDPRTTPLRAGQAPAGGAVVPWLTEAGSRRPFVMLDVGRRALVDTGSGFGLAISEQTARALGIINPRGRDRGGVQDIAGGHVRARRINPLTVRIGALVLQNVPTDLLSGTESGAPIILGREVLQPFQITFDPVSRLIQFAPR